jgi:hypothetical protein
MKLVVWETVTAEALLAKSENDSFKSLAQQIKNICWEWDRDWNLWDFFNENKPLLLDYSILEARRFDFDRFVWQYTTIKNWIDALEELAQEEYKKVIWKVREETTKILSISLGESSIDFLNEYNVIEMIKKYIIGNWSTYSSFSSLCGLDEKRFIEFVHGNWDVDFDMADKIHGITSISTLEILLYKQLQSSNF